MTAPTVAEAMTKLDSCVLEWLSPEARAKFETYLTQLLQPTAAQLTQTANTVQMALDRERELHAQLLQPTEPRTQYGDRFEDYPESPVQPTEPQ